MIESGYDRKAYIKSFGGPIEWSRGGALYRRVRAIYDAPFSGFVGSGSVTVDGSKPALTFDGDDVQGIANGDNYKVNGKKYRGASTQPDGQGFVVVELQKIP